MTRPELHSAVGTANAGISRAKTSTVVGAWSRRFLTFGLIVLLGAGCAKRKEASVRRAAAAANLTAPAVNWVLPIFTDKEGYRSMTLRGSEVRPSERSIAV